MSEPRILALDLSLTCTGWCLDGETGRITTKIRGMERLDHIAREVQALACDADLTLIEAYSYGSQGRSIFQIAELGGVIRFLLWRLKKTFVEVPPSTLKRFAAGKGNANKDAMIAAAIRRFGFQGSDNNEADAYLLWCLARHAYGSPVATVPAAHLDALAKVSWPDLAVPTAC